MDINLEEEIAIKRYHDEVRDQILLNTKLEVAFTEGIAEGETKEREKIVKSIYKNGVSKDLIAMSLNISLEEVEELLNK